MNKLYFITGSQDLYGEETLRQAADDSREMAEGRGGVTGFMEDYTYDLTSGDELELAAHMLEVSPVFAAGKPEIQVHPLGIGGKEDPARLVFDGIDGEGIAVSMIDMGDRFRLVCADITLVKQLRPMPKLPAARLMWKLKPDFRTGAEAWRRTSRSGIPRSHQGRYTPFCKDDRHRACYH